MVLAIKFGKYWFLKAPPFRFLARGIPFSSKVMFLRFCTVNPDDSNRFWIFIDFSRAASGSILRYQLTRKRTHHQIPFLCLSYHCFELLSLAHELPFDLVPIVYLPIQTQTVLFFLAFYRFLPLLEVHLVHLKGQIFTCFQLDGLPSFSWLLSFCIGNYITIDVEGVFLQSLLHTEWMESAISKWLFSDAILA